MGSETNHSKIITKAAKSILQPMGLFQKGKSRVWIDDNDWFFTVVEFQPSGFTKGSHLNVAVDFLWHKTDHLAYHFHYGDSPRANNFVSYSGNDDAYYDDMLAFADEAAKLVDEYRKLKQISFAKRVILKYKPKVKATLYDKMMFCGMTKSIWARKYFLQLMEFVEHSEHDQSELKEELLNEIAPIIKDRQKFHDYIHAKISAQRTFWNR